MRTMALFGRVQVPIDQTHLSWIEQELEIKIIEIAMEGYKSKGKDNLMTESNNIKSQFKEIVKIYI